MQSKYSNPLSVLDLCLCGRACLFQGTAWPVRCTLLVDDEPRLSLDEIEMLTQTLAWAHQVVTSPISLPAPLHTADELAKRGRENFREHRWNRLGADDEQRLADV